jgi:hypothetical protein
MKEELNGYGVPSVESLILVVRGQKVILDSDLARIYGVPTKRLNEQVRRNKDRFPEDFVFQMNLVDIAAMNRSQIATGSRKHRDPRFSPYVFTEHGAIMAANVLNSKQAVRMSVFVIRAFVKMREHFALTQTLEKRLAEIEKKLILHDSSLRDLYDRIRPLLLPSHEKPKKRIGFLEEPKAVYRSR